MSENDREEAYRLIDRLRSGMPNVLKEREAADLLERLIRYEDPMEQAGVVFVKENGTGEVPTMAWYGDPPQPGTTLFARIKRI